MKLSKLIADYGDDAVQFQNLDHCLIRANMKGVNSQITFGTEQALTLDGTDKLALIVWLDRKRVAEIITPTSDNSGQTKGGFNE